MKKHVFVFAALLLGGCKFDGNPGHLIFAETNDDEIADSSIGDGNPLLDKNVPTELTELSAETDALPIETREENAGNDAGECAENEYWETKFGACLNYPCCDIGGDWIFVFNDMSTFPWKPITSYAKIQQNKAYLKLELTTKKTDNPALPPLMIGTLEKEVLHFDGKNENGFLALDATGAKKQIEASGQIDGDYTWLKKDGSTMNGTFSLQR